MNIAISARQPFSLRPVIRSHGWSMLAPFTVTDNGAGLSYVIRLESGRTVRLNISDGDGGVSVHVRGRLAKTERAEIVGAVTWMLALDHDLSGFYRLARTEPKLSRLKKTAMGRLLRSASLFEDIVKTILTTNTTWSGTIRMVETLVGEFGDPIAGDSAGRAFPRPEQLAEVKPGRLSYLGYRGPYVHDLAIRVASGELDLSEIASSTEPTADLRKRLLRLKGVGPYAAATLLMLLGRYDYLPVDSWALRVVSHEWHDGKPVTEKQVRDAFADWGEWKALAYWFWDWSLLQEIQGQNGPG